MSVKVMGLVWDHFPEGGGRKLTALALADKADHDGSRIYPSIKTIAWMTNQSERTVQRHIDAMIECGWLIKVEQGGMGPGSTTRYRIPVERLAQGVVGRVTKLHPYSEQLSTELSTRVTSEQKRVTDSAKKGDTAVSYKRPERPIEQSITQIEPQNHTPMGREAAQRLLETLRRATGVKASAGDS